MTVADGLITKPHQAEAVLQKATPTSWPWRSN
jgi:hypothetical protein